MISKTTLGFLDCAESFEENAKEAYLDAEDARADGETQEAREHEIRGAVNYGFAFGLWLRSGFVRNAWSRN